MYEGYQGVIWLPLVTSLLSTASNNETAVSRVKVTANCQSNFLTTSKTVSTAVGHARIHTGQDFISSKR